MSFVTLLTPLILAVSAPAAPKFEAKLYAAQDSIQPGGKAELAIKIDVEKDWHAYYPITLDGGLPTRVSFEAPAGVTFGELQFPLPVLGDMSGIEFLGHEGSFVILTTVDVAADYTGATLPLRAKIDGMICKELCVPASTQASILLNVGRTPPKPANEELFKTAREAIPAPLAEAKYVKGTSVSISKDTLGLDTEAEIVLSVKVDKDHHIQHRNPGTDQLVASRLYIESLDGLKFDEQAWPEGKVKRTEAFGKVRELAGEFQIKAPIKIIDTEFAKGPIALRVLFTYQSCNEEGTCFPPTGGVGVVRFTADSPAAAPADAAARGTLTPSVKVVDAAALASSIATSAGPAAGGAAGTPSLAWVLVLAFFGGLILNVMPCVFPVISLKILGFVKQAGEDRGRILRLGLAFGAGVMAWFWLFAFLTTRGQVPFQYPLVVMALATVLYVFGLNLFGVFEIVLPGAAADKLGHAAAREGYGGAFMNGFLATLLGTACTAPFFAGAAAYASTQPPLIAFTVFSAAGIGMALPYLLLSAFPAWLKKMPRPGAWMVNFKQAMGFVLFGTTCWLLYVLGKQLDVSGVVWTLTFFCFLGFALWLIGKIGFGWSTGAKLCMWATAVLVLAFGLYFNFYYMYDLRAALDPERAASQDREHGSQDLDTIIADVKASDWSKIPWQHYSPGLAEALSKRGFTVYVDYTASWCVSCQANKVSSLEIPSTREKMKALGVIPIEADYSKPNAAMQKDLLAFKHNSVPLNLVYPPSAPDKVEALPVLLTPGIVQGALDRAGASKPQDGIVNATP